MQQYKTLLVTVFLGTIVACGSLMGSPLFVRVTIDKVTPADAQVHVGASVYRRLGLGEQLGYVGLTPTAELVDFGDGRWDYVRWSDMPANTALRTGDATGWCDFSSIVGKNRRGVAL
ncbi:MAG: hypothetical protein K9N51_07280 [Candidatus Pacebacteria bacterium]|nr:hypothetical protein [Candidatus Paceibacterota bacterium]